MGLDHSEKVAAEIAGCGRACRVILQRLVVAYMLTAVTLAYAKTDARIIERYRQMLAANPVEGPALERLWKIATEEGTEAALITDYQALAAKDDFSAHMILGHLFYREGRAEGGRAAYLRAAELNPESPLPHLSLARHLPPSEAAEALEKGVALLPPAAPGYVDATQRLGEVWMLAGQPERAAQAWERMVTLAPENLELRQRLAGIYRDKGMRSEAMAHYEYLEQHGDAETRIAALRAMAKLHLATGNSAGALDAMEKAIGLTAPDHWLRGELVNETVRQSQQAGEVAALEKRWQALAEAAPRSAVPIMQLAVLYEREGDLASLKKALEKAAELSSNPAGIQLRLTRVLVRMNELDAASSLFDELLKKQPASVDLVFERAELDVQRGDLNAAQARLEALLAIAKGDEGVTTKTISFFGKNRMSDALEKLLRKEGNKPEDLALFLFAQHRDEEARAVLRKIVNPQASPEQKAKDHERVAAIFKQVGDSGNALAELREAAKLQPGSRSLQMALGDALLATGEPANQTAAVDCFKSAYALSQSDAERLEADQRLFRSFGANRGSAPAAAANSSQDAAAPEGTLLGASGVESKGMAALVAKLLAAPLATSASDGSPENEGLKKFVSELAAKVRSRPSSQDKTHPPASEWLRLARWQMWMRSYEAAKISLAQALLQNADAPEPREILVTVSVASGDYEVALQQLRVLAEKIPARKEEFQKQMAQIHFLRGQNDDALKLLGEMAVSDNPEVLSALAAGQQKADRWYDALNSWQRLYKISPRAKRSEVLQPLVRVMQRLDMKQEAADLLWEALQEQTEEAAQSAVLRDLVAHCKERGLLPWLEVRLRSLAAPSAVQIKALVEVLKANGQLAQAAEMMQKQAASAEDRAAAEAGLAEEAEAVRDFSKAATHQRQRLKFLKTSTPADWAKLAAYQENAFNYAGADSTWRELLGRFPRSSEAFLNAASYFAKWNQTNEALELLRKLRILDATDTTAAYLTFRLIRDSLPLDKIQRVSDKGLVAEGQKAAEAFLAGTSPGGAADPLVMPPVPAMMASRVQAHFSTIGSSGGGVVMLDERVSILNPRERRLEAIRFLGENLPESERPGWMARWSKAESVSEKLWAFHFVNAGPDAFHLLATYSDAVPGSLKRRFAFIWSALQLGSWKVLGEWLWSPKRTLEEQDAFRTALGEWCDFGKPLTPEIQALLFSNASPGQRWASAEVLAARNRESEALHLAANVFEQLPPPRGVGALTVAKWRLNTGDEPGGCRALMIAAKEPSDTLDAPTFAAQRLLFLMTPKEEQSLWTAQFLSSLPANSPVYSTLSGALLWSLAGDERAAWAEFQGLISLRAGAIREAESVERVWTSLLTTGVQLQIWGLDNEAANLWEKALSDEAFIRLQGNSVAPFVEEARLRLAAIQFSKANLHSATQVLEPYAKNLQALYVISSQLEASGRRLDALRVLDFALQRDPRAPVTRLLELCKLVGEQALADAAIERWFSNSARDAVTGGNVLDFLGDRDPARTVRYAEGLLEKSPIDARLLDASARAQKALGMGDAAAQTWRKLMEMQPSNPAYRVALVDVLSDQGNQNAALELLKSAPGFSPQIEAKKVNALLAMGNTLEAKLVAYGLLSSADQPTLQTLANWFAEYGFKKEGAALLMAASETAEQSSKPHAAFKFQVKALTLLGPSEEEAIKSRWLARLNRLARMRPDLLTQYFEITADPKWQPTHQRKTEILTAWSNGYGPCVAGAWLAADLLKAGQSQAAEETFNALLARPDLTSLQALWLDDLAKRFNQNALSLKATRYLYQEQPSNVENVSRYVKALYALGRTAEMESVLQQAAMLIPFDPKNAGVLGLAAWDVKATPLAAEMFEKMLVFDSDARETAAHLAYARLLMEERQFSAAKRVLRRAFRNPKNKDAAVIVEYLRKVGKPPESEMLDLNLSPEIQKEVMHGLESLR